MNGLHEYGIVAAISYFFIKEFFVYLKSSRNGNGSEDRRQADREWKEQQRFQHEKMIESLIKINETTESTNGKCARMEAQVNILEDRDSRRGP